MNCRPEIQCAWCGRVKAADGSPVEPPLPLDTRRYSHGVCKECKPALMLAAEVVKIANTTAVELHDSGLSEPGSPAGPVPGASIRGEAPI